MHNSDFSRRFQIITQTMSTNRDFCGNDFTMDTVGGKSLSSDVTYLESLNFVSVDKLYVAPIVESNQVTKGFGFLFVSQPFVEASGRPGDNSNTRRLSSTEYSREKF